MGKILFVMRYPLDGGDNLIGKFDGQMAAVEALGHEAWFIGWNKTGMWLCRSRQRAPLLRCPLARLPGYGKTFFYWDLMKAFRRAIQTERFDAVYMRYMRLFGNAPGALKAFRAQGGRLIMEHPTYPFENGRVSSPLRAPFFWYCDRVFARIEPLIDLYALIGESCDGELHGVPAMNIVNGVDVERLPLHHPRAEAEAVGLLALASMSNWQGYDRLIEALAAYRGQHRVTIHMVGGEGDGSLGAWRELACRLGVAQSVVFHGELHGEALDRVADGCDLGIGGLGLYRKGQYRSMTLKLREYMARGLPFVYAVDDPSIEENPRFCMKLPNDDSPIDMAAIVDFALHVRTDESVGRQMRAYAGEAMSWKGILKGVMERVGITCPER